MNLLLNVFIPGEIWECKPLNSFRKYIGLSTHDNPIMGTFGVSCGDGFVFETISDLTDSADTIGRIGGASSNLLLKNYKYSGQKYEL